MTEPLQHHSLLDSPVSRDGAHNMDFAIKELDINYKQENYP